MEPYRALADKLDQKQQSLGFDAKFLLGLGITLANFTPTILIALGFLAITDKLSNGIPTHTY
jgi:maltose/moltooligosaccharide transporter